MFKYKNTAKYILDYNYGPINNPLVKHPTQGLII